MTRSSLLFTLTLTLCCAFLTVCEGALQWNLVNQTGSIAPSKRSQFAAGYSRNLNKVIIFGGKPSSIDEETWVFDVATRTWSQVMGPGPPGRFTVVGSVHEASNTFYITTGEGKVNGERTFFNDLWALDLMAMTWSEVTVSGSVLPEGRYGAGGGFSPWGGDRLFVTHGFETGTAYGTANRFDDTFAYNTATNEWENVTPGGVKPFARCLIAAAVTVSDKVAMFGGCGSGGHGPCAAWDAWTLTDGARWKNQESCISPRLYPAVSAGSGAIGSGETMFVFGGKSLWGDGDEGEVGVWDTAANDWKRYIVDGPDGKPSKRWGSAMVTVTTAASPAASDVVYVLGGEGPSTFEIWELSGSDTSDMSSEDCPFIFRIRIFHGFFMFLGWGLLLPLGVTAARFGRALPHKIKGAPIWFQSHRIFNVAGWVASLIGLVAAMFVNEAGKFSAVPHALIGAIVFLIGFQQPLNACCRPHPHPRTTRRKCWEIWHKYAGRVAILFGVLNPFWGLFYADTKNRASGWAFILYSIWIAVLVLYWIVMTLRGYPGPENYSPIAKTAGKLTGLRKTYDAPPSTATSGDAVAPDAAAVKGDGGDDAAAPSDVQPVAPGGGGGGDEPTAAV